MLAFEAVRQHGARAVLFESLDRPILTGAPHQPALRVERGAVRADDDHVGPAGSGLQADVRRIVAAVTGLLHEDRHLVVQRDLVHDVVDQAAEQQVATPAVADPQHAFIDAESAGH